MGFCWVQLALSSLHVVTHPEEGSEVEKGTLNGGRLNETGRRRGGGGGGGGGL